MEHEESIRVVYCEPGKKAQIRQLETGLESLQQAVGGLIETFYPFSEEVCIVCNDEGKLNGMKACRAVRDENDGHILDIICGPFFICDASSERFGSLSEETAERFRKRFELPEMFLRIADRITVVPYEPS